ncbi:MAG: STELLO glycosyltransferase family protein [bacterium]
MKKYIIITSIFEPSEAIKLFSTMQDYQLIVVGDKKSPKDWQCDNAIYLSVSDQNEMHFEILKNLPYNHYCRKMTGYLYAIQNGAELIIDTDDDNIPKNNWAFPDFEGKFDYMEGNKGFINIYQLYTNQQIWPRGLPLNLITRDFNLENELVKRDCKVGVWQGLADEDPDVDAIYRLTNDAPCIFNEREPIVLGKGTISPFNTQNTIVKKELFTLLYLPTYVTFRFTDILRGLIAQPIMWLYNYQLGFINATVIQKRNPHDYMKDFLSEVPMYRYSEKVIEIVSNAITKNDSIESNLYNSYNALLKENIVCDKEMIILDAWLKDINKLK